MSGSGRPLSLAPLSLPDLSPADFIACAAAAGFRRVALRGIAGDPRNAAPEMPALIRGASEIADLTARLDGEGVCVTEWEFVLLTPGLEVPACQPHLEMGARLGARWLVVCGDDPDPGRSADKLAELARLAAAHGLRVVLEFTPYSKLRRLQDAAALARASGEDVGILVDAYHLDRSGGAVAAIGALPTAFFPYVQLCDAPASRPTDLEAMRQEAREARLAPGEGDLDLAGLLAAFPPGLPVSLEVPNLERMQRLGALAYATALREAAERLDAEAPQERV